MNIDVMVALATAFAALGLAIRTARRRQPAAAVRKWHVCDACRAAIKQPQTWHDSSSKGPCEECGNDVLCHVYDTHDA